MNIIKLFIVFTTFLLTISATSATINIYDAPSRPGNIIIEAIDDCDYQHKLIIPLNLADSHRPGDWLELLMISGEWNKCLTNGM